jgi:hypothetical protein
MRQARLGLLFAVPLVLCAIGSTHAGMVTGGGPAKTDCYSTFDVKGSTAAQGVRLNCTDGDPGCDTDGQCGNGCTFQVRLCLNQTGSSCTSPGLKKAPKVHGAALSPPSSLTATDCGSYSSVTVALKKKGKKPGSKKITALAVGTDKKRDADMLVLKCLPRPAGPCPTTTTSTTLSSTTSTTSTTVMCMPIPDRVLGDTSCCAAERTTISGTGGTLKVGGFAPFPFPPGVVTILDAGAPDANCKHAVTVPAGGFVVPPFCIPALQYTSSVAATGCASGTGIGAGFLWDGNAANHGGVPATNISKVADSSDGACDPGADVCANRDLNFLGDIDTVVSAGGNANAIANILDIPAHSRTWQDAAGCPGNGVYNPADGDTLVTEFDFILSPTTGQATGAFVDKNADGCALPVGSAGFGAPSAQCAAGASGPCNATGSQPPAFDPMVLNSGCCRVGEAITTATVGIAFSNSFPLYDLGFINVVPTTVTSCMQCAVSDTCTVSTDACKF